jgi:hypothetical protein
VTAETTGALSESRVGSDSDSKNARAEQLENQASSFANAIQLELRTLRDCAAIYRSVAVISESSEWNTPLVENPTAAACRAQAAAIIVIGTRMLQVVMFSVRPTQPEWVDWSF